MPITVVFDPPLPSDAPAVFNSKAFTTLGDLNDWSTEANALASDVTAKQTTASDAATTATTQADLANSSRIAAQDAAAAAAASYDSFDDRYLGSKSADPTLDNDGNALIEGALYWNTTVKEMRTYDGTAWVTTSVANAVSRGGDTMTGPLSVPAGASGAQVPQAQEVPAIVRAFMNNAVSQSGGTPTGGIVEYGANANGTYWRLSNRLQICITSVASGNTSTATATAGVFVSAAASQTWPATFTAEPEVSVSARGAVNANCWAGDYAVSTTGISSLRAFSTINSATCVLAVVAFGRWY